MPKTEREKSDIPEIDAWYKLEAKLKDMEKMTKDLLYRRVSNTIRNMQAESSTAQIDTLIHLTREISHWCDRTGMAFRLLPLFHLLETALHEAYRKSDSGPCDHPYKYGVLETCIVCEKNQMTGHNP